MMSGLFHQRVREHTAGLIGLGIPVIAGVLLAGFAGTLHRDEGTAYAADPEPAADMFDWGDGTYAPGEEFSYVLIFDVIGTPGLATSWNNQLNPLLEFTENPLPTFSPGLTCTVSGDAVFCTLPAGAGVGTYEQFVSVRVRADAFTNPACGAFDSELRSGLTPGAGFVVKEVISQIEPCAPRNIFRLCKEWEANGAVNLPRAFKFNIADSTGNATFSIPGVQEGGPPACILVQAQGGVTVTELGIPGSWETPTWSLISLGATGAVGDTVEFFLSSNECFISSTPGFALTEALSVVTDLDYLCTLTFTNVDDGSVVTPTPTVVGVCAVCNRATPPVATSTPVTPTSTPGAPTNTPGAPTNTPNPPIATPTPGTGTQNPGLTDEQRTATAVAAARTAAAQATPIAPRTGDGASSNRDNAAIEAGFALVGLVALGTGLGLAAARKRR